MCDAAVRLDEIETRIALVEDELRPLVEEIDGGAGTCHDELARLVSSQEDLLDELRREREALDATLAEQER